jgi:murein L,D-transpeptidase YafK
MQNTRLARLLKPFPELLTRLLAVAVLTAFAPHAGAAEKKALKHPTGKSAKPARASAPLRAARTAAVAAPLAVSASAAAVQPGLAVPARVAPAQTNGSAPQQPEAMLAQTLAEIRNNRLGAALVEVEKVLQTYPNFRLAHLIRGDLLIARSRPLRGIGEASNAPRERVEDLRDEARVRLARYQRERPVDRLPRYLLQMNDDQKYALVVDTRQSTLYVFENRGGKPHYIADYYISSGKNGSDKLRQGDKKTPLGVYHVTSNLPREKLSDFYGSGAFPINYPNEWDRREGRDGSGIWLHGTPSDTFSRPPRASDGCVVLTNQDLQAIGKNMQVGVTPVIISESIEWVKPEALDAARQSLSKTVESWRSDWESLKTDAYLKHYARGFSAEGHNLAAWSDQKRRVNTGKSWIKLKLDRVSMFLYPGHENLAVVTFDQDYRSSNLSNVMRKRQYWVRESGGVWRILYEGSA